MKKLFYACSILLIMIAGYLFITKDTEPLKVSAYYEEVLEKEPVTNPLGWKQGVTPYPYDIPNEYYAVAFLRIRAGFQDPRIEQVASVYEHIGDKFKWEDLPKYYPDEIESISSKGYDGIYGENDSMLEAVNKAYKDGYFVILTFNGNEVVVDSLAEENIFLLDAIEPHIGWGRTYMLQKIKPDKYYIVKMKQHKLPLYTVPVKKNYESVNCETKLETTVREDDTLNHVFSGEIWPLEEGDGKGPVYDATVAWYDPNKGGWNEYPTGICSWFSTGMFIQNYGIKPCPPLGWHEDSYWSFSEKHVMAFAMAEAIVEEWPDLFELVDFPRAGSVVSLCDGATHTGFITGAYPDEGLVDYWDCNTHNNAREDTPQEADVDWHPRITMNQVRCVGNGVKIAAPKYDIDVVRKKLGGITLEEMLNGVEGKKNKDALKGTEWGLEGMPDRSESMDTEKYIVPLTTESDLQALERARLNNLKEDIKATEDYNKNRQVRIAFAVSGLTISLYGVAIFLAWIFDMTNPFFDTSMTKLLTFGKLEPDYTQTTVNPGRQTKTNRNIMVGALMVFTLGLLIVTGSLPSIAGSLVGIWQNILEIFIGG